MLKKYFYVYILASESGTLYIGVTNDLKRRIWEHQHDLVKGFSQKYGCHKLVYYEQYLDSQNAILREKQLKKWRRDKKELLIKKINPGWRDLSPSIL